MCWWPNMSLGLNSGGCGSWGWMLTSRGRQCDGVCLVVLLWSLQLRERAKGQSLFGSGTDQLIRHLLLSFQCRDPQCWSSGPGSPSNYELPESGTGHHWFCSGNSRKQRASCWCCEAQAARCPAVSSPAARCCAARRPGASPGSRCAEEPRCRPADTHKHQHNHSARQELTSANHYPFTGCRPVLLWLAGSSSQTAWGLTKRGLHMSWIILFKEQFIRWWNMLLNRLHC